MTFGGYDCKFMEQPPSAFQTECPVCHLLLRDPYQATCCGTSFCHLCILQVKADDKSCPICRQQQFEVFQDKRLKRSLNQLRVLCTYSKDGCKWRGELGDLDHHFNKVIHHGKSFTELREAFLSFKTAYLCYEVDISVRCVLGSGKTIKAQLCYAPQDVYEI